MPYRDPSRRRVYQNARYRAKVAASAPAPLPPSVPVNDAAETFFSWAESTLIVPTGPMRGQPFRIPEWQREYVREALADGVREAGLSVARKNGKSGLIAALALAYLCGPLNAEYWRGLVVSLTGGLAKELRDAVQFTAEASGLGKSITRLQVSGSRAHRGAARLAAGHPGSPIGQPAMPSAVTLPSLTSPGSCRKRSGRYGRRSRRL